MMKRPAEIAFITHHSAFIIRLAPLLPTSSSDMGRWWLLLALLFAVPSCSHETPAAAKDAPPPFDARRFVAQVAQTTLADAQLGAMAAKKGRLPETKQSGEAMQRDSKTVHDALVELASRRKLDVPPGVEEKKAALGENLAILPGQVFDRGWALAMVQDCNALLKSFDEAAQSGDADLQRFVSLHRPLVQTRQKDTSALLTRLGGSPFGYPP
jgi:predicted outer membrane protein